MKDISSIQEEPRRFTSMLRQLNKEKSIDYMTSPSLCYLKTYSESYLNQSTLPPDSALEKERNRFPVSINALSHYLFMEPSEKQSINYYDLIKLCEKIIVDNQESNTCINLDSFLSFLFFKIITQRQLIKVEIEELLHRDIEELLFKQLRNLTTELSVWYQNLSQNFMNNGNIFDNEYYIFPMEGTLKRKNKSNYQTYDDSDFNDKISSPIKKKKYIRLELVDSILFIVYFNRMRRLFYCIGTSYVYYHTFKKSSFN